jgi:1-acyl-sn-glycerol-3-phosphate acyltransferase
LKNTETQQNKQYAPFTRSDFAKWDKTTFLFCGLILLPIRIIVAFSSIVLAATILKINAVIFKIKDYQKPQPAVFIKICKITLRILGRLILFCWGYFRITHKTKKVNPSNASYFKIIEDVKHATIVCNHTAFIDIFLFFCQERPVSFISNQAVQDYPLVGIIAKTIQCVFVNRINKESRAKCLDDLKERAANIRKDPNSNLNFKYIN